MVSDDTNHGIVLPPPSPICYSEITMKKLTPSRSVVVGICGLFLATFGIWQIGSTVLAEQVGSSPESGATSRIKTIYDSLDSLSHGSDSAGSWGNWGSMWNRIRSAGEWVPTGDASEADVVAGKLLQRLPHPKNWHLNPLW